jgi:hypothetical protein
MKNNWKDPHWNIILMLIGILLMTVSYKIYGIFLKKTLFSTMGILMITIGWARIIEYYF